MERMESMEPISAHYTTAYPEIHPDSGYESRETADSQAKTPPAPTYDEELVHKTILVGDSGVGKTSLLVQFDQGKFIPGSFSATVGIGFTNKVVTVDDVKVKLQIWDTAGQERFRSVTHAYYRDAHALLLLYDITSKTSFDNIRAWLTEIHEYAQSDVVIMLLGNKADMSSDRAIRREEGERLARVSFSFRCASTTDAADCAAHCCFFLSLSPGAFSSLHGDKCQDRSQRRAGLHGCVQGTEAPGRPTSQSTQVPHS
ncbi:ras-related protein Rab-37-like isoform X1 [Etheostoma cragini]|uniref:ras-related protein Rab-37-like isoform X1 n=1 Tax=Etheostoma cragini TaxID=417921 RepID=UPI00155F1197|nr:ras-related protein Rab-37-like isoform X1 [Etheostoma cragini]